MADLLNKKLESFSSISNEENFQYTQTDGVEIIRELTVEITLSEYRRLLRENAEMRETIRYMRER